MHQGQFQHLVDPLHRHDLEAVLHVVGDLGQILDVLLGDERQLDARTLGSQQLLLQASDGQHLAAQRDLAGHGHIGTHRNAGQHRHQRRGHGDTRAGAVLGRGALGHVDVDVLLLVEVRLDAQLCRTAAHHGHRGLDGLLHHVAQLAGGEVLALARHGDGLDGEQLATHFRPGQTVDLADLVVLLGDAEGIAANAQEGVEVIGRDGDALERLVQQQRLDGLAADLGQLTFQRAHAGLPRVEAQDVAQHRFAHRQLTGLEAVVPDLLGQQVTLGNRDLLVLGVAGQADDFHPVQQRRGDVEGVGRGHEHHVGQVVVDLDVVVGEGVVLLGVEHLQQGRSRVTTEVLAHLVDFVEQEERIAHADLGDALQDLARHRADVGAAVATDLGLVTHAAQGHAHELAVGGTRDGLTQRGLAHARRSDQAQDRGLHLVDALLHREVFEDALLDLLQPVVVLVEHLLGMGQVIVELALLLPRQGQQRVDVVAHHGGLGRHGRHQAQLAELALAFLAGLFGHAGGLDLLLDVLEVGAVLALTQFLLDGLDLLVQVVLTLALLHLALDAPADALLDLQDVEFVLDLRQQLLQALAHRQRLQHFLLLLDADGQVCGDGVGQATRVLDAGQRGEDLGGHLLVELHVVLELRQDGAPQGFDLGRDRILVMDVVQLAREVLTLGVDVGDACTADALDQHLDGTVGQLQELQDVGNAANAIDVAGGGVVLRAVLLGNQHDALAGFHGRFQRLDGTLAAHEERDHHVGEDHHVAQGQQWQGLVGNMAIVHRFPEKCADRCTRDRPGRQGSAYEASGDDSKRLQEYAEVVASFLMKPCPACCTAGRGTGGRHDPSEGGAF